MKGKAKFIVLETDWMRIRIWIRIRIHHILWIRIHIRSMRIHLTDWRLQQINNNTTLHCVSCYWHGAAIFRETIVVKNIIILYDTYSHRC